MKFDCGLTTKEKQEAYKKKITDWHRVFLWFPKRVGHRDCRWLEYIERKRVTKTKLVGHWINPYEQKYYEWEYRPIRSTTI